MRTIDNIKTDKKEWKKLILKNPKFLIFKHNHISNLFSLLSHKGIKASETFEFVKSYPDLMLANRHNVLLYKLSLFDKLQINKSTVKNLVKAYPFILLKSYNSFIDKVSYFSKELKLNIEEIDIYPIIYVYDLKRDIIPRCEMMKRANKWLPFKEAFSMSLEDLAKKLTISTEGLNSLNTGSENSPVYEREMLFKYSKYHTI
jgi:hypothetical protein